MQYVGSKRKAAAFSLGMAGGIFGFHYFPTGPFGIDYEVLPDASIAALTVFAGTLVGILVWSSIGEWLKKRRTPSVAACIGIGVCFALALMGVFAIAVNVFWSFDLLDQEHWSIGVLRDIAFWLALSLWNSVGYGLAVSPIPRAEPTSAARS